MNNLYSQSIYNHFLSLVNRNFTPYIYSLFFIFIFLKINSQEMQLEIIALDTINNSFLKSITYRNNHAFEKETKQEIASISIKLSKIGFIENYLDSIHKTDSLYKAYFFLGENTQQIVINYSDLEIEPTSLEGLHLTIKQNKIYCNINQVPPLLNKIVSSLERKGNSFAEASLKNIIKSKNGLIADLYINKSTKRTIDYIKIKGYDDFPKSFTKHYLGLKTGKTFNTKKLNGASISLKALPFASEIKSPEILFAKDSTTIYLYLQKNKNNQFDGLIGFSTSETGKLKFNGYLDLWLNNIFNKGESISLYWKSNGNERKVFNFEITTPFIFGSPISPKATFNIYKQDSTFLNIKAEIDIAYIINSKNSLSSKFKSESSNDLNETFGNSTIKGYKNSFYGFGYTYKLPNLQNSYQNKFYLQLHILWGNRSIASATKKENQNKYELKANYIWSLNYKNSIFIQNTSRILISENFYTNELYRVGGTNSIRGFNEASIFSSAFSIINIEYRYNINTTSYFYSITDYALIQNKVLNTNSSLYSFGLGYSYGIKSGLINISYAVGKQEQQPLNFNNSKFHIKLTQYF